MTRRHTVLRVLCGGALLFGTAACAASSLVAVSPTNDVTDPSVVQTPTGAVQLYASALARWAQTMGSAGGTSDGRLNFQINTALFTDELMRVNNGFDDRLGTGLGNAFVGMDERNDGSIAGFSVPNGGGIYLTNESGLHGIRNWSIYARETLAAYAPNSSPALRGQMLAAEAFAIVYFAEYYCSGVALSTSSVSGKPTVLTRGFTTEELLDQAVVKFDSALALTGDSARITYLAAIGKGRALLDAGKFADAAAAVAGVPTDYIYILEYNSSSTSPGVNLLGNRPQNVQIRDNEGGNGLVWTTDPRTATVTTPSLSGAMPVPGKYSVTGGVISAAVANPNASIRAADGLEARLIEAEAALAQNDPSWLTKLNALRSACVGSAACAPVPGLTTANLPPLADPGNANARLDLVMKERAMWLYLTGHRQGDLRRLAHQYHRDPMTLWPVGLYTNPGFPPLVQPTSDNGIVNYINQFVIGTFDPSIGGVTRSEQTYNPLYTGCVDLNP